MKPKAKIIIELKVTRPDKEPDVVKVNAINDDYAELAIAEIHGIMFATTHEDPSA